MIRAKFIAPVAIAAALGMSVVATASASAQTFKASATGNLVGKQTSNQVFEASAGKAVTCTTAATKGEIEALEASSQVVTVEYSGCSAFGFVSATVSKAEYDIHANGEVDVLNTIKISVPLGKCEVTVAPQSKLGTVSFENKSGKIEEKTAVTGITSTSTGSLCGTSGKEGKYTGSSLVEGPGTLEFIA